MSKTHECTPGFKNPTKTQIKQRVTMAQDILSGKKDGILFIYTEKKEATGVQAGGTLFAHDTNPLRAVLTFMSNCDIELSDLIVAHMKYELSKTKGRKTKAKTSKKK